MVPLNCAIIQMRSDIIQHDPDGAYEKMEQVQRVFGCVTYRHIPLSKQISQNHSNPADVNLGAWNGALSP